MSDIAGPPAPKEIQPSVRGADKLGNVAKDPNHTNARTPDQQHREGGQQQAETQRTRDPAVSIASTAAKLEIGQELRETVSQIDPEGRPVIVTDTATFALKPDAGLKQNDAVVLRITEVENRISANLLSQNTRVLDPPTQVTLTVTHIYNQSIPETASQPDTDTVSRPYQPPLTASVSQQPDPATVFLTAPQQTPPQIGEQQTPINPQTAQQPPTAQAAPVGIAKLIETQGATQNTSVQNTQAPSAFPAQTTNIPASQAAIPQAITGPGIGPGITSISPNGAPAIIQVLDPSLSSVAPRELATVTTVSPLTADQAIALNPNTNLRTIFGNETALSTVETNSGTFIAPTSDVSNLTGELVRLAVGVSTANVPVTNQTHSALFIEAKDGALPQKISVSFSKPEVTQKQEGAATATINVVHTLAAFLGPEGPKADIRLETSRGDVSLTIPSAFRPVVGDHVHILSPEKTPQATSAPATSTTPTHVAPPEVTAPQPLQTLPAELPAQNILTNWPALQESIAALASTNPATASLLQSKTAQGGGKLTNSLLFFLAAAGRAAANTWTGASTDKALQNVSGSLLKQLHSDVRQMANLASDTTGEWRPILLPLDARPSEVPLAALLVQQNHAIDPDEDGANQESNDSENDQSERFILQVQFSVLGDIQLDGRIHKQQFDLTIRSARRFNSPLEAELKDLFQNSLAANGYAGSLTFEEQYPFTIDAHAVIEEKLTQNNQAS